MRLGGNAVHTTAFEVNGAPLGKSTQKGDDSPYSYHHSSLGVFVRGQLHLWWLLDMGFTRSKDRGRVPLVNVDLWRRVMDIIFEAGANLIQTHSCKTTAHWWEVQREAFGERLHQTCGTHVQWGER